LRSGVVGRVSSDSGLAMMMIGRQSGERMRKKKQVNRAMTDRTTTLSCLTFLQLRRGQSGQVSRRDQESQASRQDQASRTDRTDQANRPGLAEAE
jgi:hypothetical protein